MTERVPELNHLAHAELSIAQGQQSTDPVFISQCFHNTHELPHSRSPILRHITNNLILAQKKVLSTLNIHDLTRSNLPVKHLPIIRRASINISNSAYPGQTNGAVRQDLPMRSVSVSIERRAPAAEETLTGTRSRNIHLPCTLRCGDHKRPGLQRDDQQDDENRMPDFFHTYSIVFIATHSQHGPSIIATS